MYRSPTKQIIASSGDRIEAGAQPTTQLCGGDNSLKSFNTKKVYKLTFNFNYF